MKQKKIKESKLSEKELEKFRIAVDQTADAVFITDPKGKIQYVNKAFENLTGFSKKESLGKSPSIIKSGLQSKAHYKKLWSTITSGKTFRSIVVNRKKNGELFYADHTITPLKDHKENIIYYVAIWKDISEKILEEKQKDEFISMVSHELKTPVTSIKAFLQILEKQSSQLHNQTFTHILTKTQHQVSNIITLIEDLLNVVKIREGKLELHKHIFNFNQLIKEEIENMQPTTETHTIILQEQTKQKIYADKYRISQVITNFLSNAIKYSRQANKIIVTISKQKNNIICHVQDFGIGIKKQDQEKVFDRFFRASTTNGKIYPGIGLGLYIAAEIIKKHKGKIWVESNEGKGSTFFFSLPLSQK